MNSDNSHRMANKLYEMIKEIITNRTGLEKYSTDFLQSLQLDQEIVNLHLIKIDGKYFFKGYPKGDLVKVFCKILELWYTHGSFPVNFQKIEGLKDQTANSVDILNTYTGALGFIFKFLQEKDNQSAFKSAVSFLDGIGMRGFMTLIGIRKTSGSCEEGLLSRELLFKSFNAIFKVISALTLIKIRRGNTNLRQEKK